MKLGIVIFLSMNIEFLGGDFERKRCRFSPKYSYAWVFSIRLCSSCTFQCSHKRSGADITGKFAILNLYLWL